MSNGKINSKAVEFSLGQEFYTSHDGSLSDKDLLFLILNIDGQKKIGPDIVNGVEALSK